MSIEDATSHAEPASGSASGDVTRILEAWAEGDAGAADRLFPLLYDELHAIAGRHLGREKPGHTLQTTALIHEAYLKLVGLDRIAWKDRVHFLSMAARVMRRVLIDHAEARKAAKRGGGLTRVSLSGAAGGDADGPPAADLLDLDAALRRLATKDERQVRVVECRFFGGMSIEETASALDVSPATVKRDWSVARAWLNRELSA